MFSNIHLYKTQQIHAANLYCELHDFCRVCGSPNHFSNDCNYLLGHIQPWVYRFGGILE